MDLHPYYPLLARTPLLRGMRPDELDTLLDCIAALAAYFAALCAGRNFAADRVRNAGGRHFAGR